MNQSLGFMLDALPTLLQGTLITLQLTVCTILLGSLGGVLLGIARLSQLSPLRLLARVYIDFFRGTPLLVQLFMIYFGVPALFKSLGIVFSFDQWTAAILGLSL
ncbi:MAG: ABC transporter permease subunit, partial [Cyanobacteria bacterium J06621_11]